MSCQLFCEVLLSTALRRSLTDSVSFYRGASPDWDCVHTKSLWKCRNGKLGVRQGRARAGRAYKRFSARGWLFKKYFGRPIDLAPP